MTTRVKLVDVDNKYRESNKARMQQAQQPQQLLDSCPYWIHGCKDCEDPYEGCDDDEKMRSPNCPAFHNPQAECTKIGYCTKPSASQQRIEQIVKIINEYEGELSDGYDYYGGQESVKKLAEAIALLQAGDHHE